jgi:hypothetical protein
MYYSPAHTAPRNTALKLNIESILNGPERIGFEKETSSILFTIDRDTFGSIINSPNAARCSAKSS